MSPLDPINPSGEALLDWLKGRRSVRRFLPDAVPRAVMERLIEAATSAPSNTNRSPWRFAVVTAPALRAQILEALRARVDAMTSSTSRWRARP
jgi:nitroreductase